MLRRELRQTDVTRIPGDGASVQSQVVERLGFDSLTHYQWCHILQPKGDYRPYGEQDVAEWEKIDSEYNIAYFPHVSVGWDSNSRFTGLRETIITGNTPDHLEHFLHQARKYVDERPNRTPLITVNSWNEWSESSYLQPDTEHAMPIWKR